MRGSLQSAVVVCALALAAPSSAEQFSDVEVVDESYGYLRDSASYDSDKDVIITQGIDIDFGAFWVAFQCSSNAAWFMNKLTGQWKNPETLPEDMVNFHDTLCAQRKSLPYLEF